MSRSKFEPGIPQKEVKSVSTSTNLLNITRCEPDVRKHMCTAICMYVCMYVRSCESQKRLTAPGRKMTRRARVAWRTNIVRKDRTRNQAERGSPKRRKNVECNSGIRDRGLRQPQQGRNRIKNPATRRQPRNVREIMVTGHFNERTVDSASDRHEYQESSWG
jgi:hypothetical protein